VADDVDLSRISTAEVIPPALAAPKRARKSRPPVSPPNVAEAASVDVQPGIAAAVAVEPAPVMAPIPAAPQPVSSAVPTPPAAVPAEPQREDAAMATNVDEMKNTAQQMGDAAKDQAQAMFADVKGRAEDAVAKGQRFWAELAEFNKGNVEAMVESGRLAARGFEQLGRDAAETARRQFEATSAAVKTLAQAKSPTEFVRLQGEYARTAFDQAVADASRSTEVMLKLVGEIAQPISNRAAVAADRIKTAA